MLIKFKGGFPFGDRYRGVISIAKGQTVEVPNELGERLLKDYPDLFVKVEPDKKKTKKRK